jgi:hypothetical protein
MAQTAPAEGFPEEMHRKVKHYIDTKRYIEEPELLPWYKKDLDELKPRTRELFEKYCHIAPAEVETHVRAVVSLPLVFIFSG